jgi:CheY-like chemotaxis protein
MPAEHLLVIDDSPTVLKVVEVALTKAGYLVATAAGGPAGLARARQAGAPPDVILLDSAMPGPDGVETGFDICRQLASDARLGKIPVILMAPKGEDLEQKFSKASNVVDYITKPFSPEAIQAVVSHVVEKRTSGPRSAGRPLAVTEALSQSTGATPGASSASRARNFDDVRSALVSRLESYSYRPETGSWDFSQIVQGALDDETLARLMAPVAQVAAQLAPVAGVALAGDLRAIAISEILSLLQEQSQTGCLRAEHDAARIDLFFRKGELDFAAAVGVAEEFLLGRFAIEAGDLTPDALTAVLDQRARSAGKPGLFGADLVERGLITPDQLKQAITRQTAELAYEVLRWDQGQFSFQQAAELPELARDAALAISVDALLLEGFRRVDEWRIIEREIESFDLVFVRNEAKLADVARGKLTSDEIAVLDFVNGRSSVREIIRGLRMGSFDVTKILYRLLRTKLIRRRVLPVSTS